MGRTFVSSELPKRGGRQRSGAHPMIPFAFRRWREWVQTQAQALMLVSVWAVVAGACAAEAAAGAETRAGAGSGTAGADFPAPRYTPVERLAPERLQAVHEARARWARERVELPEWAGLEDYRAVIH